jgi:ATP-dependent exoDNAse (exonuclease V) beta subunit
MVDQAVPDPLPQTLQVIPPDRSARRKFSVSEIEAIDAELRRTSSGDHSALLRLGKRGPGGAHCLPGDVELERDADESGRPEQLGHLVHSALERIDFQNPQDVATLIAAGCGSSERHVDEATRAAAIACVVNVLRSPLGRELATARQIHREIEFLLPLPPHPGRASTFPPLHQGGPGGVSSAGESPPIIISGTIDCLFESADGGWTIFDYKTGIRQSDTPAAALLADYEIQLGLYALAVEQLIHRLPDRIELVFMRTGVDRIAFEPTAARLEGMIDRVARAIERLATA